MVQRAMREGARWEERAKYSHVNAIMQSRSSVHSINMSASTAYIRNTQYVQLGEIGRVPPIDPVNEAGREGLLQDPT